MSESAGAGTPKHLWIVGGLSLLWNAMGAFDYLATQLEMESYLAQFSEEQLEYFLSFPAWAVAVWAFGVWGGFAGSIGLLLRRSWAVWMFEASLLGVVISTIYNFGFRNGAELMGTGGMIFSIVILLVAILLVVYSVKQRQRGVLKASVPTETRT